MKTLIVSAATLSLCSLAAAQVTDGTADAAYGNALAVQNVQTQFGDANLGTIDYCNGSEIDAAYARIDGGFLFVVIAGNIESNYNKMELFVDCKAGGQNRLLGTNKDVDFNGLNRMGESPAGAGNGLTFDTGFEADAWFSVTCGGSPFAMYSNWAEILTGGGAGQGGYLGTAGTGGVVVGANGVEVAINNSNALGVAGGTQAGDGTGIRTGVEWKIPLSVIGYTSGPIKICAMVNGGGHDYLSNQVIGGVGAGTSNLAEPRLVNFALLAGNQFFTVGTVVNTCPADLNGDRVVDGGDLGQLLGSWGAHGSSADLNGDGTVDGGDLGQLLGSWGACH
jgi:hypothetical protein